jgi:nitrogen-specific signal transduction histidine kinase
MIPPPVCVLYTQDPELSRRVKAYLRTTAQVRHVATADRLEPVLQQVGSALVMMDLRAKECRELIEQIQNEYSDFLIIALGTLRSEPLREAEQLGIYAAEDLQLDRRRFQALVGRAFDYLKALQENRDLRETSAASPVLPMTRRVQITDQYSRAHSLPLLRFPRALCRFENVDALLESIVEAVADAAGASRVGIFSRIREGNRYRLRAGLRCLPETSEIEFGERDALVRWFEQHAQLISRANLGQTIDQKQRLVMRRALDSFGAEVVVPLYMRGEIIGWLFFGNRVTGEAFDNRDLEGLMMLAEHVSTVLENALLYEETTLQKTLAETLLKSIPPGIVAIDDNATVRWFNPRAEQLLDRKASEVLNKPVETVGSGLAGMLRETLESKTSPPPQNWIDTETRRSLSVETRRLVDNNAALGAVAVISDLTTHENIREKQALVDRASFWTDLAASMSHEIRNPLVAIKTFAQLLPERFDDAEFRKEFNQIVVQEIDRLDQIINQINNFAHPPELVLKSLDVRASLNKALDIARSRFSVNGDVDVETSLPTNLPRVLGDETALAEAFAHLVANAAEAVEGESKPRIVLSAKPVREGGHTSGVVVSVRDNGHGIAAELKDKIFSPFYTTKPRGMGLGLPIVKRTVFDHNGRVDVDSSPRGTQVSVTLPATPTGN